MVQGWMAPSVRLRSGYGTINARSYSSVAPNPLHVGQAPLGLLNEKSCGDGGGATCPSFGHWNQVVNRRKGGRRTADEDHSPAVCPPRSAVCCPPSAVR